MLGIVRGKLKKIFRQTIPTGFAGFCATNPHISRYAKGSITTMNVKRGTSEAKGQAGNRKMIPLHMSP